MATIRSIKLHQVTFDKGVVRPRVSKTKRVGRPRRNWTTANMNKKWKRIQRTKGVHEIHFDRKNIDIKIRKTLLESAQNYDPPFKAKQRKISRNIH